MILAATSDDVAIAFIELGAIVLGLAVLARMSDRLGVSPIPAYLVAGLLFGDGGLAAPISPSDFLHLAAEIGVVLLLLTLGLEYTPDELGTGCGEMRPRASSTWCSTRSREWPPRSCSVGARRRRCCSAGSPTSRRRE